MKLLILYQFYLDYFLPRGNEWKNKTFGFQLDDSFVIVRPKNIDEDLFPNDIDKTLSTMSLSLKKLDFNTTTLKREVKNTIIDRIDVRLERVIDNFDVIKNMDFQQERFDEAIECCNTFLNRCRVLSMNPFIRPLPREFSTKHRRFFNLFPHTVTYLDKDNPAVMPDILNGANAIASLGNIRSPESGNIDVNKIPGVSGLEPYNSLIVDSQEMISAGRLKEAILLLAICCETRIMRAFTDKGIPKAKLKKPKQDDFSFAGFYFDSLTKKFIKRSLRDEDKRTFDYIEKLYKVRNNIVHKGICVYYEDGKEIKVDENSCINFMNATEKSISWINDAFK